MKIIIIGLLLTVASTFTLAGTLVKFPVEINLEERRATGNMTAARFSSNEFEEIGCAIRTYRDQWGNKFDMGSCRATLVEGESSMCTTENMDLIQTIRAMNDYSYVIFTWNDDGECQLIGNSTRSQYIPGKLR
jgi:hypothetical protein